MKHPPMSPTHKSSPRERWQLR